MREERSRESINLGSNELMLNSKGFVLFFMNNDGSVGTCGHIDSLSITERLGLLVFGSKLVNGYIDKVMRINGGILGGSGE